MVGEANRCQNFGAGVGGGLQKGRERKKREAREKEGGVWVFLLFSASSGRTKAAL